MPIMLDRRVCCDLNETISREWLITNSLGGYASGTVAGVLTRAEHGLLVALPPNDNTPHLLVAKIDEEVIFDRRTYYLGTNEYRDGLLNPSGFVHLETFRLEDGFPIFTYRLGGINGIILEKRIWMPPERNTTCIQYRVISTIGENHPISSLNEDDANDEATQNALRLTLLPFTTYRPYQQSQPMTHTFQVESHYFENHSSRSLWRTTHAPSQNIVGATLHADSQPLSYHILALCHPNSRIAFLPTGVWYSNFLHRHNTITDPVTEALYLPGVIRTTLWPAEDATLTVIVSTENLETLIFRSSQLAHSYKQYVERQQRFFQVPGQPHQTQSELSEAQRLLPLTTTSDPQQGGRDLLRLLTQAGDRFLFHYTKQHTRPSSSNTWMLRSNFYDLALRTRDTLLALPGLTLDTKRYAEAESLLRLVASHFQEGLLPEYLTPSGQSSQEQDQQSIDTPLWFFYTLDHYLRVTRRYSLLEELYGTLKETLEAFIHRPTNSIYLDSHDGLLSVHQSHKALTWMNTNIDGMLLTPRSGKPVEVNALWYHALSLMHEWSHQIGATSRTVYYKELATLCHENFQRRFWYEQGGYLYDVVDGPQGNNDPALRPNQLFSFSLRYPVLEPVYWQQVHDVVSRHLLTPYGLRTLAPHDANYRAHTDATPNSSLQALHQGSVWPWLLGPYIDATLMLQKHAPEPLPEHGKTLFREYLWRKGLRLLEPLKELLSENLMGMCGGALDGEAPHHINHEIASALSIGELLRVYDTLARLRTNGYESVLAY
jgi:glycogen debranching enzyme